MQLHGGEKEGNQEGNDGDSERALMSVKPLPRARVDGQGWLVERRAKKARPPPEIEGYSPLSFGMSSMGSLRAQTEPFSGSGRSPPGLH